MTNTTTITLRTWWVIIADSVVSLRTSVSTANILEVGLARGRIALEWISTPRRACSRMASERSCPFPNHLREMTPCFEFSHIGSIATPLSCNSVLENFYLRVVEAVSEDRGDVARCVAGSNVLPISATARGTLLLLAKRLMDCCKMTKPHLQTMTIDAAFSCLLSVLVEGVIPNERGKRMIHAMDIMM